MTKLIFSKTLTHGCATALLFGNRVVRCSTKIQSRYFGQFVQGGSRVTITEDGKHVRTQYPRGIVVHGQAPAVFVMGGNR